VRLWFRGPEVGRQGGRRQEVQGVQEVRRQEVRGGQEVQVVREVQEVQEVRRRGRHHRGLLWRR
jgi:hypothetical protein